MNKKRGIPRIEINFDAKCKRCGEEGATQNGLCLGCITLALEQGEFDHILEKHKQPKRKKS